MRRITAGKMLPAALNQVNTVLTRGGEKHGDAWKTRDDIDDVLPALMHIREYINGDRMTDYGVSPLAHAVARLMMIIERGGGAR